MALFYDRDYGRNWNRYDRGYRGQSAWGGGYDTEPGPRDRYDRGYKSRWQTDHGDPFGDRSSRTPMRMIRGEYRGGEGGRFGWGGNYDRQYSSNPMGYDPYFDQSHRMPSIGRWNRYDRGYRGRDPQTRYDAGWF